MNLSLDLSFWRLVFLLYIYVYATLQCFFLDQIRSFILSPPSLYLNSHRTKLAIKLWVVAQSLPLVCKRSYYFGWIFNTLSASTEFHSSSIKILIFLLNVFNTTVRIVKQLNIRNSKSSIGTASPAASEFVFFFK